jgi:hypothetical protein
MYNKLYTAKEIEGFERVNKIQTGKTMQQRLGKPDWIHTNKGKSAYEIYGDDCIFTIDKNVISLTENSKIKFEIIK